MRHFALCILRVRREHLKSGGNIYFPVGTFIDNLHDTELFQFCITIQTISAFSFHSGDPHPAHGIQKPFGFMFQFFKGGFPVARTVLIMPPPRSMMLI